MIEDKHGSLTLIRLVDKVTAGAVGPDVPDEMPPLPIDLTLVVMLKSDQARGRHKIRVRPEKPSATYLPDLEVAVQFDGGERGVNVVMPMGIEVDEEGLYWFDVFLGSGADEQRLSRVPLRVVYQPQKTRG